MLTGYDNAPNLSRMEPTHMNTENQITQLRQQAADALKAKGIKPDSKSAYEVWFRHFDSDTKDIIQNANENNGDIIPWLYDTASIYADADTNYATPSVRRIAKKFLA